MYLVSDRSQGDVHPQGNPHIQTNPHNILLVAEVMTERMVQLDPGNAGFYQQNLVGFPSTLEELRSRTGNNAPRCSGGKRVIAHHKSWVYLEAWLGLVEVATLEPVSGIPPTASHLGSLLERFGEQRRRFYHPRAVPKARSPPTGYRNAPAFRPFFCR